jgi:HD-GYP domain-containing protein (c-di-GMP phosphodiesterase class II)
VADVYDALTSERPYRTPMPREKALEVVRQAGGSQLCPDCLAAFLEYMESLEGEVK